MSLDPLTEINKLEGEMISALIVFRKKVYELSGKIYLAGELEPWFDRQMFIDLMKRRKDLLIIVKHTIRALKNVELERYG